MRRRCMQTLKRPRVTGRFTMGLVTLLGSLHGCGSSTLKVANVSTTSLKHVVRLWPCLVLLNRVISTSPVVYSELLRNRCGLTAVDGGAYLRAGHTPPAQKEAYRSLGQLPMEPTEVNADRFALVPGGTMVLDHDEL